MYDVGNAVSTADGTAGWDPRIRRVRDDVRDGLAVVAFSAAASSTLAVLVMLLTRLAG